LRLRLLVGASVTVTWQQLQGEVLAVPGIAAAEVEARPDQGPFVRVWLDGTRDAAAVAADVRRVLDKAGYGTEEGAGSGPAAATPLDGRNGRRSGLGRGLEALIPPAEPAQTVVAAEGRRLDMIAVEETASGTVVRAIDNAGKAAVAPVPLGNGLNAAVTATVAGLLGLGEPPRLEAVEVRDLASSPVLMVVIATSDGRRASGSAIVEAGMPFTLGRAVWAAIQALG
jgi:hypothetical protein